MAIVVTGRGGSQVPSLAPSAPEGSGPVVNPPFPAAGLLSLCRVVWAYPSHPCVQMEPYRAAAHLRAAPLHRANMLTRV